MTKLNYPREIEYKGRVVVDITVTGIDTKDWPDFCDAYADFAIWGDTGEELTDQELEDLTTDNPEVIQEIVWDILF